MTQIFSKNNIAKIAFIILTIIAFTLLFVGCGEGSLITAALVPLVGKEGYGIVGEPLTTTLSEEASPGLLMNEIDRRIVKVRPMATPIDQISRHAASRHSGSMTVEYYIVDNLPASALLSSDFNPSSARVSDHYMTANIKTDNDALFQASETIMLPDIKVKNGDHDEALVLYVVENNVTKGLSVIAVNNIDENLDHLIPQLATGTKLVRMGRAAAELDVQTAQYVAMPHKNNNYCQIFKAQVEQSTYQKIANKEAGWNFSDQEEAAVMDMRLGMEKNFIFGHKGKIYDTVKREDIMLTGGIWYQAGKDFNYDIAPGFDFDSLVALGREAFTGCLGSSKKLLIGGSKLIESLHRIDHQRVLSGTDVMTRWGLDFTEIVTKFGRLYVLISEVFDQCGHENDGMVIDPEYITKYVHVPFSAEKLNLRQSGVRNTDAVVLTEASCLVLRNPKAHIRIVGK